MLLTWVLTVFSAIARSRPISVLAPALRFATAVRGADPLLARWIAEGQDADPGELFELGLACLVDGIDVRLTGPDSARRARCRRASVPTASALVDHVAHTCHVGHCYRQCLAAQCLTSPSARRRVL